MQIIQRFPDGIPQDVIDGIEHACSAFKTFAFKSHGDTNHFYDKELPYSFHLKAASKEGYRYMHLLPDHSLGNLLNVASAIYGHDLIEDARVSYNDVKSHSNQKVAEVIRAVTNYGRGRTRAERMPDYIYEDIRNTENADFVKLCDRLANVKYSIFTESSMTEKYRKENDEFITKVTSRHNVLQPMIRKLSDILSTF